MNAVGWIYELKDRISGPLAGVRNAMQATDNVALKLDKDISGISGSTNIAGSALRGFAAIASTAFAGLSLGFIGKQIFDIGTAMEDVRMNYETLLQGNTSASNKLIEQLLDFGRATKFSNQEVLDQGQSLLAFGVAGDKILPTIKTIGDLSLGDSNKFKSLVDNYGKMFSAQRGNTMDINQFALAGIPIWKELEKITGLQGTALRKYVEQNGVSIKQIDEAFKNLTGSSGIFFNALQRSSNTTLSKLGNLLAGIEEIAVKIFNRLQPTINAFFDWGIRILPTVSSALNALYNLIVPIVQTLWSMRDIIVALTIAYAAYRAIVMLTTAAQTLSYLWMMRSIVAETLLTTVTEGLAGAQALLNRVLYANPLGIIIALVASAVYIFYRLWYQTETGRAQIMGLWEILKVLGKGVWDFLISPFTTSAKLLGEFGDAILNLNTFNFDGLKKNAANIEQILKDANPVAKFQKLGSDLGNAYNQGFDAEMAKPRDKNEGGIMSMIMGGMDSNTYNQTKDKGANYSSALSSGASSSAGGSGGGRNIYITIKEFGTMHVNVKDGADFKKQLPELKGVFHELLSSEVRDFEVGFSNGG